MFPIVRGMAVCLIAGASLAALAQPALGQPFPARPVQLVSQFPPGGQTDVIARLLAPRLAESTGQTFVVENKAGAAGLIGADYVVKAPPDGYTVLVGNNSLVTNAVTRQQMPFDPTRDLAPVAMVASVALALAVHPSVEARSVRELVELVRSSPGRKWSYSSCGNDTPMHLTAELFKQVTRIDMEHVPYKGCGPAIADGVGGHVRVLFNNVAGLVAQEKGGKLRVLAVTSAQRSALEPNIPTIAEAGYEGFEASIWIGFLVPAATPREIVQKLHAELTKAANLPDVREKLRAQLMEHHSTTPEQFAALIRSDIAKWSKVVREAKLKPN